MLNVVITQEEFENYKELMKAAGKEAKSVCMISDENLQDKKAGLDISDIYRIEQYDSMNVCVKKKYIPQEVTKDEQGNTLSIVDKEPAWKVTAYYPSVEMAIKDLIDEVINNNIKHGLIGLQEAIKELKTFKEKYKAGERTE